MQRLSPRRAPRLAGLALVRQAFAFFGLFFGFRWNRFEWPLGVWAPPAHLAVPAVKRGRNFRAHSGSSSSRGRERAGRESDERMEKAGRGRDGRQRGYIKVESCDRNQKKINFLMDAGSGSPAIDSPGDRSSASSSTDRALDGRPDSAPSTRKQNLESRQIHFDHESSRFIAVEQIDLSIESRCAHAA